LKPTFLQYSGEHTTLTQNFYFRHYRYALLSSSSCSSSDDPSPSLPPTASTIIELDYRAAKAFPDMLDNMYGCNGKSLKVTTTTAVSLRYLGDFFGARKMFDEVNAFIKKDMGQDNVHMYLKDALAFRDKQLIKAATDFGESE
jgi:hypothetical protein